ncbi:MAG: hypothetical protein AB1798_15120 [Spirochaetota bacterium]
MDVLRLHIFIDIVLILFIALVFHLGILFLHFRKKRILEIQRQKTESQRIDSMETGFQEMLLLHNEYVKKMEREKSLQWRMLYLCLVLLAALIGLSVFKEFTERWPLNTLLVLSFAIFFAGLYFSVEIQYSIREIRGILFKNKVDRRLHYWMDESDYQQLVKHSEFFWKDSRVLVTHIVTLAIVIGLISYFLVKKLVILY